MFLHVIITAFISLYGPFAILRNLFMGGLAKYMQKNTHKEISEPDGGLVSTSPSVPSSQDSWGVVEGQSRGAGVCSDLHTPALACPEVFSISDCTGTVSWNGTAQHGSWGLDFFHSALFSEVHPGHSMPQFTPFPCWVVFRGVSAGCADPCGCYAHCPVLGWGEHSRLGPPSKRHAAHTLA